MPSHTVSMVRIVEILDRSVQGVTKPFLCKGEDGLLYFVKGNLAGRDALCREWLASQIAAKLGLPVPPFQLVRVPAELITFSARADKLELGGGVAFGSQRVEYADELRFSVIGEIEPALKARILLFDWWVRNGDRSLRATGGNPNLLWSAGTKKLYVIDHNLAFDSQLTGVLDTHAFADARQLWDAAFRSAMTTKMASIVAELAAMWDTLPAEWIEDGSPLELEEVRAMLNRFQTNPDVFWRVMS
jgi:hypothetical protein